MPKYDDQLFSPPAPVATVTLRNPASLASVSDVPMLIDSGADVTVVPQSALDSLGVLEQSDDKVEMMGFDGQISISAVVQLDLIFNRKVFKGRFPVINQEGQGWRIIGRDILNHLAIMLDGPKLDWDVRGLD